MCGRSLTGANGNAAQSPLTAALLCTAVTAATAALLPMPEYLARSQLPRCCVVVISWTATARRCCAAHRCHRAHRCACLRRAHRCHRDHRRVCPRRAHRCPAASASPRLPCPAVVVQSCLASLLVVGISSHHGRMSLRMDFDVRMLGGILETWSECLVCIYVSVHSLVCVACVACVIGPVCMLCVGRLWRALCVLCVSNRTCENDL